MKGSVFDIIFMVVAVFFIAIGVFFGHAILDEFDLGSTELNETYMETGEGALQLLDWGLIFILIMMIIGALVLASQIRTHPVFIIPAIIIILMAIFVAVIISNVFEEITLTPEMANTSSQFGGIVAMMSNLPLIIFGAGCLIVIILYGKTRDSISEV